MINVKELKSYEQFKRVVKSNIENNSRYAAKMVANSRKEDESIREYYNNLGLEYNKIIYLKNNGLKNNLVGFRIILGLCKCLNLNPVGLVYGSSEEMFSKGNYYYPSHNEFRYFLTRHFFDYIETTRISGGSIKLLCKSFCNTCGSYNCRKRNFEKGNQLLKLSWDFVLKNLYYKILTIEDMFNYENYNGTVFMNSGDDKKQDTQLNATDNDNNGDIKEKEDEKEQVMQKEQIIRPVIPTIIHKPDGLSPSGVSYREWLHAMNIVTNIPEDKIDRIIKDYNDFINR